MSTLFDPLGPSLVVVLGAGVMGFGAYLILFHAIRWDDRIVWWQIAVGLCLIGLGGAIIHGWLPAADPEAFAPIGVPIGSAAYERRERS